VEEEGRLRGPGRAYSFHSARMHENLHVTYTMWATLRA